MKFHENLISIILTEDVLLWFINSTYKRWYSQQNYTLLYVFKIENSCYHLQYVDQQFFSPYMCKNIFEVNRRFILPLHCKHTKKVVINTKVQAPTAMSLLFVALTYRHDPCNHSSHRTAIANVVFMLCNIPAGLDGS